MDMIETLAKELSIGRQQAESAVRLLDEDNTIPFIARYRKEVTGGLDDTVLRALEERLRYLRSLQKRREEVFALIQASGKLNEQQLNQVEVSLQRASLLSEVEDIYRPYKQKRKTRASAAREKGLEPLAQFLQAQRQGSSLEQEAQKFIDPKKGVEDAAQAIAGAQDILAEQLSDSPQVRARLRDYLQKIRRVYGVETDFVPTKNGITINLYARQPQTHKIFLQNPDYMLVDESYSSDITAKITAKIAATGDTTDWYLLDDDTITTDATAPNRVSGEWRSVIIDDSAQERTTVKNEFSKNDQ